MKILNSLLTISCMIVVACAEKTEKRPKNDMPEQKSQSVIYSDPLDSVFAVHFALLDSVLANKYHGDSYRVQKTMLFMDTTTGIPAKGDGTPFGWFYDKIKLEQYQKWKKWYDENKNHLKWDKGTNRIVRVKK
jgi:hypothetical protein